MLIWGSVLLSYGNHGNLGRKPVHGLPELTSLCGPLVKRINSPCEVKEKKEKRSTEQKSRA